MAATCISELEVVQSVMPSKATDPREPIIVNIEENPSCLGILKRCFNVVLCYNEKMSTASSDAGVIPASGSLVAAWIKESLTIALSEQPMLAGRLRRSDSGEFEMVPNDSGVRLLEMKVGMSLNEFLALKVKNDAESQLVFWEDLDLELNPQYSPLFYVQVTNFSCGGYSVGINCNTLLTDPFTMMSFIKRWTDIHIKIVSKSNSSNLPIFYRQNHRNNGTNKVNSPALPFGTNKKAPNSGRSVIFTMNGSDLGSQKVEKIAAVCIGEMCKEMDQKNMNFSDVLVKEVSGNEVKVQRFSRKDLSLIENDDQKGVLMNDGDADWDDLGAQEMCFEEGNKPVHVSCWISSDADEALLMIVDHDSGIKAVITL